LFVSIDTFEIYRDNGTTWDLIGGPGSSTVTGTGAATQVAFWTAAQTIGGSNNLWWDSANSRLGIKTSTPSAPLEVVQTDGIGVFSNFTTVSGSGSGTTAFYSINNTASSGYAAVIEEKTTNTTGGQYPLLVKHSLSSGTAAVGNGTGLQFQLQDDAGAFKTTQLTIETIDAAAATYATRYRFNVQNNGSSTPAAYLNATGLGLGTATPGTKLDIHGTGVLAQLNSTGTTNNGYLAFQRAGTTTIRIGDTYNSGTNYFGIYSNSLSADIAQFFEGTGKTVFQATQTYSSGLARANYFAYNLTAPGGTSFSSPNAITALGAQLNLTLQGSATIPSGARTGLDAYNAVSFTGAGTLTMSQGTQIRAYSNLTAGWAFSGIAAGTITHLAGLRVLFPDSGSAGLNITNNYGLLINDQTANTGSITYTNRWGIYQEGTSDLNYFAANTLIGTTTNSGQKLVVNGSTRLFQTTGITTIIESDWDRSLTNDTQLYIRGNSNTNKQLRIGFDTTANVGYLQALISGIGTNDILINPSGGNLGLGVTPSAWRNTDKVFQNNNSVFYNESNTNTWLGHNYYEDSGGNYLYITSDYASTIRQTVGQWIFYNAPTGTAGNSLTFTERFRINAGGLVGINTSNPTDLLTVSGTGGVNPNAVIKVTGTTNYATFLANNNSGQFYLGIDNSAGTGFGNGTYSRVVYGSGAYPIDFYTNDTIKARLTSGGNFLIGTTTDGGAKLSVNGSTSINTTTNATYSKLNVAGSIHFNNNADASVTDENNFGNAFAKKSTVTGGAGATTIKPTTGPLGGLYVVTGSDGPGNMFVDIVLLLGRLTTAPIVISSQNYASPATRTYTNSGENLQLSLSGSSAYSIYITGIGSNETS
jgi:hypothetical protein